MKLHYLSLLLGSLVVSSEAACSDKITCLECLQSDEEECAFRATSCINRSECPSDILEEPTCAIASTELPADELCPIYTQIQQDTANAAVCETKTDCESCGNTSFDTGSPTCVWYASGQCCLKYDALLGGDVDFFPDYTCPDGIPADIFPQEEDIYGEGYMHIYEDDLVVALDDTVEADGTAEEEDDSTPANCSATDVCASCVSNPGCGFSAADNTCVTADQCEVLKKQNQYYCAHANEAAPEKHCAQFETFLANQENEKVCQTKTDCESCSNVTFENAGVSGCAWTSGSAAGCNRKYDDHDEVYLDYSCPDGIVPEEDDFTTNDTVKEEEDTSFVSETSDNGSGGCIQHNSPVMVIAMVLAVLGWRFALNQ